MSQATPAVKAIECRFATYCPPPKGFQDDYHLVKEIVHYEDGTVKPNLRVWKNYKRPFYITQQHMRKHKDKKESEKLENVNKFSCRQFELTRSISMALGDNKPPRGLKDVCSSPYVYGADITSTAVLKRDYQAKYPINPTPFSLVTLDIETDMDTKEILMQTIASATTIYTVILKRFVSGYANVEEQLRALAKKYAEPVEAVKREWIIEIVDTELEVAINPIKKLHEWKPDVVAIWNILFDLRVIEDVIRRNNLDPADIFSDPCVPAAYRRYEFVEGPDYKVSESGVRKSLESSERWHWIYTPASFCFIDAMCLYRAIRNQETKDPKYSLDYILQKELQNRGKLHFEDLTSAEENTPDWHIEMQAEYHLEYIVYNRYDSSGMLDLDNKTKDIALNLAFFSGVSDFAIFPSQPRRIVDDLDAFYMKKHREVVASTGKIRDRDTNQFLDKFENLVIGRDGWIATLDPELFAECKSSLFIDAEGLYHSVHTSSADSDVTSAYPNGQIAMNISKATTHRELVSIDGVPQRMRRIQGLNLSGGYINAVEIATELYGLPHLDQWAKAYREDHQVH